MPLFNLKSRFRAFLKGRDHSWDILYKSNPEIVLEHFLTKTAASEMIKLINSVEVLLADDALPPPERAVCLSVIEDLQTLLYQYADGVSGPCVDRLYEAQKGSLGRADVERWLANSDAGQKATKTASANSHLLTLVHSL